MSAIRESVATLNGLYKAEYHRLLRVSWVLTGSYASAEDLVQDVFVQAHRHWDHVAGLEQPEAWLRRVLVNRARSQWRRQLIESRHSGRDEIAVVLAEGAHDVWDAVQRLSRRQREIVALVFVEDRTVVDAARLLGCSEETARTHLRRALARLQAELKEVDS
jgi:RNA polymerase sigma factor (sigma-70 family)